MRLMNSKLKSSKIFLGLSSFQILAMFRRGLFYTYLSIYFRSYLSLTVTETTLYATLPMIMSVIFQNFVWGPISDKFQRRRTLIISGEILAGIGTILVWFIHYGFTNLFLAGYVIIFGLSCIEIFWSMSNIGWSALISDLYPSLQRSKVMGQLTSIGGLGRIVGISIGGLLYDNGLGFRDGSLFFVASFVMFISTLPMLFTPEGGISLKKEPEIKEAITDQPPKNYKIIFTIFIISLIFINFGRNSISIPYSQYLTLESGFGVNSIVLSYIANTRSVAVLLIGYSAGFLSKKFGHSKTLILGSSLSIAALFITALSPNLLLIYVGSFLIGTGEVIITASSYAIASDLIPERFRAKLFGVYNTTFFLSWGLACTLISAPIIDLLIFQGFDEVFAYMISFLVGAFITLIGLIIFIILELIMIIKKKSEKKF
ncbi:MAG: MFS transporter [Promethearchaeota archaeon]|nr:MAG: MFS transporter [Candidatus Lokiarchaeota archaeon]